jgi:nucleoid-associated protein EbfC
MEKYPMMMFDMAKMMKQAKKMQDKMMEIQEELAVAEMEGKSADGTISIKCTGKFEGWLVSGLTPEQNEQVKQALEALAGEIMEQTQSRMGDLTKGLNIPGLKLPGM